MATLARILTVKLDPKEKRRLIVKLLRDAADFVEAQESDPAHIGPLIWDAMLAVERRAEEAAEQTRQHRPPAA